jgi:hypothetical protein
MIPITDGQKAVNYFFTYFRGFIYTDACLLHNVLEAPRLAAIINSELFNPSGESLGKAMDV